MFKHFLFLLFSLIVSNSCGYLLVRSKPFNRIFSGPGHTDKIPTSTLESSRKEVMSMVISTAIFYLTLKINLDKIFNRNRDSQALLELSENLKYEIVNSGIGNSCKQDEEVILNCRKSYNGLPLDEIDQILYKFTPEKVAKLDSPYKELVCKLGSEFRNGDRYKVTVPANIAYAGKPLPTYLSDDVFILFDISITKFE